MDGVIISDLPPEEAAETWKAFDDAGVDTITPVAPTTDEARVAPLVRRRRVRNCLARTGVTGRGALLRSIPDRVALIRRQTALPVAVGFGISSRDDARALRGVADAVIVGAAFVRRITEDPREGRGRTRRGVRARTDGRARRLTHAPAKVRGSGNPLPGASNFPDHEPPSAG